MSLKVVDDVLEFSCMISDCVLFLFATRVEMLPLLVWIDYFAVGGGEGKTGTVEGVSPDNH